MSEEEVKVVIGGKLVSLKDLEKQYADISISGAPGNVKVMQVLTKTEKPLTRQDIAKQVKMTVGYVASLLKRLVKQEYVLELEIRKVRNKYYLMTEKGFSFFKKLTS